ncbi:MAG: hypothetical protein IKO07_04755 [Clostridia bacterium]|nr:hypothetical protein [Clostridia bacterium]
MSYSENILIRTRDCDMYGRWKPSAILETMQETATAHCAGAGLGRAVTDGLGVVWVVSRCRVEMARPFRLNETCAVETFALPGKHMFFPRGHVFRDAAGEVAGGALSLWLLLDVAARRAVRQPFVLEKLPVEAREAPAAQPRTVRPAGEELAAATFTPPFTDFDVNGHVNNTKYMDWFWNALGAERLEGREIAAFDINYDSEILPGEVIETALYRTDENAFAFCGGAGEKRRFGISAQLRDARR